MSGDQIGETDPTTLQVRALETMSLQALRDQWRSRYGPPPTFRSAPLLRRLLAWRLQAEAFGGLNEPTRLALRRSGARQEDARLRPGAKLSREWRGVVHEVEVVDGGYLHDGRLHPSLSAAATAIAGSRWNGPRFFGLRSEGP